MDNLEHSIKFDPEITEIIDQLLQTSEQKLEEVGKSSATQAFNLGCTAGLIPAGIIILITFIATKAWLAVVITTILMLLALVGLANLAALLARSKAMERVYKTEVAPEIERSLQELQISALDFDQYTWQNLPETAYIRQFRPKPLQETQTSTKRRILFLPKTRK
jgi:glucan phosphoethanolaminetransferase (alkaline phosphatase superfamily)